MSVILYFHIIQFPRLFQDNDTLVAFAVKGIWLL